MKTYKVIDDRMNSTEFNNFKKASEFCIKQKGMLYVIQGDVYRKFANWSELDLREKTHSYHYVEKAESKIYKCNKCGKINIRVNYMKAYCDHCNGGLIRMRKEK